MSDRLWDASDVAGVLGMKRKWVENKTREGVIPGFKPGGGKFWRYDPEEIKRWIDRQGKP